MRQTLARTVICAMALAAAQPAFAADPITGRWVTEDKDAVIEIAPCGKSLCGRIVRFLVPPPDGPGQRDVNNPDKAKRNRTLMGLAVLTGFREEPDLWRGRIYDPKSGRDYRSVIRRKGASTIEVRGCIGPFCQAQVWKRAK
jgi:uncharacterized protein (DUF2147 family)